MSEFTFNIADYRPLSAVRMHRALDRRPTSKRPAGFVVLDSKPEIDQREDRWLDTRPEVVDIRSHRSGHLLAHPRRAKVLRFTSEAPSRVCTMPVHGDAAGGDDDPDPQAA